MAPTGSVSKPDPRAGCIRSRLFGSLPVLALLLTALGLLAVAPAQAQPVWSATLTVKAPDGDRGCYGNSGANGCNTAFDDNDFTHDDTDYTVHGLIVSEDQVGNRHLDLLLSKKIPDALKALKLCVGTTGYTLSDGTISDDEPANDDNAVRWRIAADALDWSVGNTVPVSLASSCTVTFGFENAAYLVKENAGSFVLAVQASSNVAADTTITIAASDGTSTPSDPAAERGTDYGGDATRTVTMTAGTDRVEFTQVIHDDNAVEPDEKFTLTISSVSSGTVGTPASTVITIEDQDVTVQFASTAYEVAENSTSARTVVLTATGDLNSDFTVGLRYEGYGTKPADEVQGQPRNNCADNTDWDHLAIPASVTFLSNQARVEVPVTACDNADYVDHDESFTLSIEIGSPHDARVTAGARASTTVTIRDKDHSHGVSPGMPVLMPVESGDRAPTETSLSVSIACVSPGKAPVTNYLLEAEDRTSGAVVRHSHTVASPCVTETVTVPGLASGTTYRVRAWARNLFARSSPLSDWVELATTGTRTSGGGVNSGSVVNGQTDRPPVAVLRDLYGRNGAETISGLCGTRVVLAAPDRDTAQWSADSLGRSEVEEVAENVSYGANTIRDGVSLTPRRELRALALPADIMRLPNLHGFLKFPGPYPVASIRLKPVDRPVLAPRFAPRGDQPPPAAAGGGEPLAVAGRGVGPAQPGETTDDAVPAPSSDADAEAPWKGDPDLGWCERSPAEPVVKAHPAPASVAEDSGSARAPAVPAGAEGWPEETAPPVAPASSGEADSRPADPAPSPDGGEWV